MARRIMFRTSAKAGDSLRPLHTVVNDVELFKAAKAIREWLSDLVGNIPRLHDDPNPYYGSTIDGLTLIAYYGGPSSVGTPLGEWACTGGGVVANPGWLVEATERLGLVELMPNYYDGMGERGPIWSITKDLDGNALPQTFWNMRGYGVGLLSDDAYSWYTAMSTQTDIDAQDSYPRIKDQWESVIRPAIGFVNSENNVNHKE